MSRVILEGRNIYKKFGDVEVLKNITFEIKNGELISIIGRSGCGKTTLLRCINCLEIIDSGYLRVGEIVMERNINGNNKDDELEEKAQKIRRKVGLLFQSLNLFPHLTVLENIILAPIKVKKESRDV
ncbi:MAG: ATP-binding cassette domain-containing protein, partial [Candidatus Kapaibacteriota bacterium]